MKPRNEFVTWMGPLLDCLRALGGSARPKEVSEWIAKRLKLPQVTLDKTLQSGGNRFHNQVQWARQNLVWEGLLDGSRRGMWTLTPKGWSAHLTDEQGRQIHRKWVGVHQKTRKVASKESPDNSADVESDGVPSDDVQEIALLGVIRSLPPAGFEMLCQRLLRESGFEEVVVTGRSHDGGIDGIGFLRLNPFITLKTVFQCKNTIKSIGRAIVGDFRNAMLGRAEKGILITTSTFSSDAIREACRDGAPAIELVDGETLVEMFESTKLGVRPKQVYEVDHAFFDQFRSPEKSS